MKKMHIVLTALMALHNGIINAQDAPDVPKVQKEGFITRAKRALTYKKIKRSLTAPAVVKAVAGALATALGLTFGKRLRNRNWNQDTAIDISEGKDLPKLPQKSDPSQEPEEPWEKGYRRPDGSEPFTPRNLVIDPERLQQTLDNAQEYEAQKMRRNLKRTMPLKKLTQGDDIETSSMSSIEIVEGGDPFEGTISDKENDAFGSESSDDEQRLVPVANERSESDDWSGIHPFLVELAGAVDSPRKSDNKPIPVLNDQELDDLLHGLGAGGLFQIPIYDPSKPVENRDTDAQPSSSEAKSDVPSDIVPKAPHAKRKPKNKQSVLKGRSAQAALAELTAMEHEERVEEELSVVLVPAQPVQANQRNPYPVPYNGYLANQAALRYLCQLPLTLLAQKHAEGGLSHNLYASRVYCYRFMNLSTQELFEEQKALTQAYKKTNDLPKLSVLLEGRRQYQNWLADHRGLPAPR